jgi:ApaG protein
MRDNYGVSNQPGGDKFPDPSEHGDIPATGIRTSDTTTEGIRIQVKSFYLADRSSPREGQFYFAYTIRISNVGLETAQLLTRHWIITDAEGELQEVRGEGVVGKQPVLEPGTSFEYTSYCPLKTNVGTMHGSYTLARPDGRLFDAQIAPFTLAVPNALN